MSEILNGHFAKSICHRVHKLQTLIPRKIHTVSIGTISLESSNFWGLSSEMRIFKLAHAFSIGDSSGLC